MHLPKSSIIIVLFISLTILTTLAVSSGCARKNSNGKAEGKVYLIEVDAENNANMGKPVTLDFVSAYDEQVVDTLETITASEWFKSKNNYILQFEGKIFVFNKEFVPGHQVQLEYTTGIDEDAIANFIFANYHSPGEHRIRVDKAKIDIKLKENDFEIIEK